MDYVRKIDRAYKLYFKMGKLLSKQYHRNKCEKYVRVMVNLYKVSNWFENHKYCYLIWAYKFHHYVKHEKNDKLIQQSKIFTCVMVLKPFGVLNSLNSLNFWFFFIELSYLEYVHKIQYYIHCSRNVQESNFDVFFEKY